jgi:hypothetical protein
MRRGSGVHGSLRVKVCLFALFVDRLTGQLPEREKQKPSSKCRKFKISGDAFFSWKLLV